MFRLDSTMVRKLGLFLVIISLLSSCKGRRHQAMVWSPNGCVSSDKPEIKLHLKSVLPYSYKLFLKDSTVVENFQKTIEDSIVVFKNGVFMSHFKVRSNYLSSEIYTEVNSSGIITALDSFFVTDNGATKIYFDAFLSRKLKLSKTFFSSGQTQSALYYYITGADSLYKEWYIDGKLKTLKKFKDDKNIFNHYPYPNKKPFETTDYYSNGVISKIEKQNKHFLVLYRASGIRKFTSYDSIFGKAVITCEKKYYPNNKLQSLHFFQDKKPCHTWLDYSDDGKLAKSISKSPILQISSGPREPEMPEILTFVEEQAEFPSGATALQSYLKKELEFMNYKRPDLLSGKYTLRFDIKEDGTATFFSLQGFASEVLQADLKQIINSMPRWKARKHNGRAIKSTYEMTLTAY